MLGLIQDVTETKRLEQQLQESKERYESLKKYHPDGIFSVNFEGNITGANPAFETMTGYGLSELKTMTYHEIVDPHGEVCIDWVLRSPTRTEGLTWEGFLRYKSGVRIQVNANTVPIVVRGGVVGNYVIMKDVTETKQVHEALRQSRDNLDRTRQFANLANWELDLRTKQVHCSDEAYQVFGLANAPSTDLSALLQFVHPDDIHKIHEAHSLAILGKPYKIEYRVLHPNGEERVVLSRGEVACFETSPGKLVGVIQDVTERKRAETALETSREMLQQADKLSAVGQMAAGIAHEIRNPLAAIMGFTQLLHQKARGDKKKYFDVMMVELKRIHNILGELLILAKPQPTNFEHKNIRDILDEVVAVMASQAALHDVVFEINVLSEMPAILCEPNQLKQVFVNVIKNAIEAMPQGGGLTMDLGCRNQEIYLVFTDQGIGIPEDTVSQLGEPFFTTKQTGTGLGLMVSHRIVESHGGRIQISSRVGQGTSVKIVIPVQQRRRKQDANADFVSAHV